MGKTPVDIAVCSEARRAAALRLVMAGLPQGHRQAVLESLAATTDEPLGPHDALVTAVKGPRLLAAAWAQPQPGRTVTVWPPRRAARSGGAVSETLLTRLLGLALQRVDAAGVSMSQTLLESEDAPCVGLLRSNDFQRIASLRYLEWGADRPPPTAAGPAPRVTFEPRAADHPERLRRVVEATYHDTMDCPRMEGARNLPDALHGYRQIGRHDPALWLFVGCEGVAEDAGVLLLTEHPATRQMELVYMGVVPAARGRRIGLAAVRKGQELTRQRGLGRMVLAVDSANTPATRAYADAGFKPWASRIVYVRRRP